MNLAGVLFVLLSATAAGYALVRFVSGGLTRKETVAWSFAAGWLVQSAVLLAILAAGGIPGPKKILGAEALVIAVSFAVRRGVEIPRPSLAATPAPAWPAAIAAVLAAAGLVLFAATALSAPMDATDFLAIWGLKGRTIFATSSIPDRLFHDRALEWAHPEYPLAVPLAFAALAAAARTWDDRALALFYPLTQAATVLVLWGYLRRRASAEAAAAGAALVALCLPLYSRGNLGTAEIPVALGFVLAATSALDARQDGSRAALARLALASLFCSAIKLEGALFVLLLAAALLVLDRRRALAAAATAAVPVVAHELALRLLRGPVARRDYDLSLLEPRRWTGLLSNIGTVVRRLTSIEIPHAAVALAAVLLFLLVTRRGFADWLLFAIVAQIAVYAAMCALCAFGPVWLVQTAFSRITMALVPVLALALVARLGPLQREAA